MDQLSVFLSGLAALVPTVAVFSPLISYAIDAAKRLGLPDGSAPLASGLLNLAAYTFIFFASDATKVQIPGVVSGILVVAPYLVALVTGVLATPAVHEALIKRGIGFSHNAPKVG